MPELALSGMLNQIHHGDCIAGMNALPAGTIDLAFADPPFNIGYDYDVYNDARGRQEYLEWSRTWIAAVHRVLKSDGAFWLAIGDEYAAELKIMSQELGFHCRSWVIWYYTFGVNCKYKFSRSHAHLFHFLKDPESFTFRSDLLENRIPSARQLVYADKRANSVGRLPDDTWILRPQDLVDCLTPGEDTWYFPRVAGTFKERAGFHGCQMPEQLLGRIIKLCSHEEETVLDPFSGSATTLAVAKKLGRQFLGFDLSDEYIQRGRDRLANCRVGDLLDGAAEPAVSAPATPPKGSRKGKLAALTKVPDKEAADFATKAERLFETGLIEAFAQTCLGYSPDRVVADPELNQAFVGRCRELGLLGEARIWNWRLFNSRKAGRLTSIPITQRTELNWQDCDEFLFASEIALATMLSNGSESLDAILCDPEQARRFDAIAMSYHPGLKPFQYRWGALMLRQESQSARARADVLGSVAPALLSPAKPLASSEWNDYPDEAGLYLVLGADDHDKLYAGSSLNLRQRLQHQFTGQPLGTWQRASSELRVRYFTADPNTPELLAYQCLLIREHQPKLNLRDVAVGESNEAASQTVPERIVQGTRSLF
ncbi:MAG: DNA methyltransferase [Planctomycetaceae bacterium]